MADKDSQDWSQPEASLPPTGTGPVAPPDAAAADLDALPVRAEEESTPTETVAAPTLADTLDAEPPEQCNRSNAPHLDAREAATDTHDVAPEPPAWDEPPAPDADPAAPPVAATPDPDAHTIPADANPRASATVDAPPLPGATNADDAERPDVAGNGTNAPDQDIREAAADTHAALPGTTDLERLVEAPTRTEITLLPEPAPSLIMSNAVLQPPLALDDAPQPTPPDQPLADPSPNQAPTALAATAPSHIASHTTPDTAPPADAPLAMATLDAPRQRIPVETAAVWPSMAPELRIPPEDERTAPTRPARRPAPATPTPAEPATEPAAASTWSRAKPTLKKAGRTALMAAAGYLALIPLLIPVYRFVNPPASALMVFRFITGTSIDRTWVPLERISPNLVRAVVVAEDDRFCEHSGIDLAAMSQALESGGRGASTISMQVTKNLFLWNSRSYIRKLIEVPLTLVTELVWPKWRILELYLNVAEWGPGVFGAEAAARHHFNKPAARLTASEAALLAASLPNPFVRDAGDPNARTASKARVIQSRVRAYGNVASCVTSLYPAAAADPPPAFKPLRKRQQPQVRRPREQQGGFSPFDTRIVP